MARTEAIVRHRMAVDGALLMLATGFMDYLYPKCYTVNINSRTTH